MESKYSINFNFTGVKEFNDGWQLLWVSKWNQDEAVKLRKEYYKQLIKALKPRMIADNRKPNKGNIYYYSTTPEYKEWMDKINDVNKRLSADNAEYKKYEAILKTNGDWEHFK